MEVGAPDEVGIRSSRRTMGIESISEEVDAVGFSSSFLSKM
jgi:hypothetical protein